MGSQCNHGIFIGAWAMFGVWGNSWFFYGAWIHGANGHLGKPWALGSILNGE